MKLRIAKPPMPKIKKATGHPSGSWLPRRSVKTAFGTGNATAFHPPSMTAPDQAFEGAMAMPQGGGDAGPAVPAPPEG